MSTRRDEARPVGDAGPVRNRGEVWVVERWARGACLVGLVVLAVLVLWPTLGLGYFSDDVLTSLTPGILRNNHMSLGDRILDTIRNSMREGRFYPLHWIPFSGVFWLIRDVQQYRIYIVGCVVINLLLFVHFVRRLSGSAGLAYLAACLTCMLFQLRAFHDPILSFFGLLQMVVALTLLSLIALWRHLEGGGRAWLIWSILIYITSVLLYEMSYLFFLFHAFLIGRRRLGWRPWLSKVLPFAVAAGFGIGMSFLLRWLAPASSAMHTKYGMVPTPGTFLPALARQISGALPLTYFAADPAGIFRDVKTPGALVRWLGRADVLAVALVAMGVCSLVLLRLRGRPANDGGEQTRIDWGLLVMLGLLLAVVPGVMTSMTARYQQEVTFGMSYVPVYTQYFGVALVLASVIWYVLARWAGRGVPAWCGRVAVAVAVGLTTAVTYRANRDTAVSLISPPGSPHFNPLASLYQGQWHYQRLNLELALQSGLMDEVPEHSTLRVSHAYPTWHDGTWGFLFYATHARKVLKVLPPNAPDAGSTPGKTYLEHDVCLGRNAGYVVLSEPGGGEAGEFRLFVHHPHLFRGSKVPAFLVVGRSPGAAESGSYLKPARELRLLRSGPDWAIFSLRDEAGRVDPGSIELVFDPSKATQILASRPAPVRR